MICRLRSHIILLISTIHAIPNLFFNFSRERRVPSADKLPVFRLFIFYSVTLTMKGFFFSNRGVNVILVQELFLIFLHELSGGIAFKLADVIGV